MAVEAKGGVHVVEILSTHHRRPEGKDRLYNASFGSVAGGCTLGDSAPEGMPLVNLAFLGIEGGDKRVPDQVVVVGHPVKDAPDVGPLDAPRPEIHHPVPAVVRSAEGDSLGVGVRLDHDPRVLIFDDDRITRQGCRRVFRVHRQAVLGCTAGVVKGLRGHAEVSFFGIRPKADITADTNMSVSTMKS